MSADDCLIRGNKLTQHRFVVVGWSIKTDEKSKQILYQIDFKRIANQLGMDVVLRRPFTDEVEDYKEYKRIRQAQHDSHAQAPRRTRGGGNPIIVGPSDGTTEEFEPFGNVEDWLSRAIESDHDLQEM